MNQPFSSTRRDFLASSAAASAMLATSTIRADNSPSTEGFNRTISLDTGHPLRIAAHPDDGFVVSAIGEQKGLLQVVSQAGRVVMERALPRPVRAIVLDQNQDLFIGMGSEIHRLSADTLESVEVFSLPNRSLVTGIVTKEEALFATDASRQSLWRVSRADAAVRELSKLTPTNVPAEFFHLRESAEGELLIGNPSRHRIETYSPEGKLLARFGHKSRELFGFSGCCNPVSFVVLGGGSLLTAEQGIPRIKLYSLGGRVVEQIAGPEMFAETVQAEENRTIECGRKGFDLAIINENEVAVLDRAMSRIHVITV